MRDDERAWEPYGPAMVVKVQASLDASGRLLDWSHDTWSTTHMSRALPYGDRSALLGARFERAPDSSPSIHARGGGNGVILFPKTHQ